jgi:hypothetical protein
MPERKLNGRELMHAQRWDEALQAFKQEIEAGQFRFYSYTWRGLLYRHLNKVDAAIADFSVAIKSPITRGEPYTGYWDAFYYRGNAYLAQRKFAQAEADHRRYIELISERSQKKLTEHQEIQQRFKTAVTPLDPENYQPLGLSFKDAQDCRLALADYEFAIANAHATPLVYFGMGAAYECLRDYFRAIECYRKIGMAGDFSAAVKIASERAQQAALYVEPKDKQLLQPGIEYLTIHGDMDADSFTCHYFDLEGERQEELKGMPKPSPDWTKVASRSMRELYNAYYQRKK